MARLAGARPWQQLRDVVLPTVRRHVLTNTLLITLWTFNDFTPYLLTAGGPIERAIHRRLRKPPDGGAELP